MFNVRIPLIWIEKRLQLWLSTIIVQVWFDYRPTQINFILNQNRIIHLYKLIILRESRADLLSGCQVVTVKGKGLRLYFL